MDEYLSRRIKNWGAWQRPDPATRARLLDQAAAGLLHNHRQWARWVMPHELPEKNLFANQFSRHNQLAFLNLEVIYRSSPLRYA